MNGYLSGVFAYRLAAWLLTTDPNDTLSFQLKRTGDTECLVCQAIKQDGTVDLLDIPEKP